jgi:hypothetical protein
VSGAGRGWTLLLATTAIAVGAACGGEPRLPEMHMSTESYSFTIIPSLSPPHAREPILYKIIVKDRSSQQPIQDGEGQIFANTRDGAKTYDGLVYGPEVGTYYGKLNYTLADLWAVAIRFRRDSLHPLERQDWMQDVLGERSDSVPK